MSCVCCGVFGRGFGGGGRGPVRERDGALSSVRSPSVVVSIGAGAGIFGSLPSHKSEK